MTEFETALTSCTGVLAKMLQGPSNGYVVSGSFLCNRFNKFKGGDLDLFVIDHRITMTKVAEQLGIELPKNSENMQYVPVQSLNILINGIYSSEIAEVKFCKKFLEIDARQVCITNIFPEFDHRVLYEEWGITRLQFIFFDDESLFKTGMYFRDIANQIHAGFDYSHCMATFIPRTKKWYMSELAKKCIEHKVLLYVNQDRKFNKKTIERYDKFLKRGLRPSKKTQSLYELAKSTI